MCNKYLKSLKYRLCTLCRKFNHVFIATQVQMFLFIGDLEVAE